jgi:DNA uptake protein ComE-like DNA-binding protein
MLKKRIYGRIVVPYGKESTYKRILKAGYEVLDDNFVSTKVLDNITYKDLIKIKGIGKKKAQEFLDSRDKWNHK